MTPQIALALSILLASLVLFVTEWLRVDLVAMLVLAALALTGLVSPEEALSGFSNPAVITVWAVFILSGGLSRTGIANLIGRQVLRIAPKGEAGLLLVIMLTAGMLSAFMNNVGVTALMLPVVLDVARQTGHSPSKLLMPLAFGSILGGLTTQIGTPSNILASDLLADAGLQPFTFFDFAPVGLVVMLVGTFFVALAGRRLLPTRDPARELSSESDLGETFHMEERLFTIHLPIDSPLAGKQLSQSRLGSALGFNVIGILRRGENILAPPPDTKLQGGDRLFIVGRADKLTEINGEHSFILEEEREHSTQLTVEDIISTDIDLAEARLAANSELIGQSLTEIDFRARFALNVIAIRRDEQLIRTNLQDIPLQVNDTLLVQGTQVQLEAIAKQPDFHLTSSHPAEVYRLHERLLMIGVSTASTLNGKTLEESQLADAYGFSVLGIIRQGRTMLMPKPSEKLQPGDRLLVEGKPEDIQTLHGLQDLEIDQAARPKLSDLESAGVGMVEVALSPHTNLVGKTLRQLHFREKYGLSVLAILRGGHSHRSNLRDMALRFGDALLVHGPRERIRLLADEANFLILTQEIQAPPRTNKAPLTALIMGAVVASVALGWLPIAIAAVVGAAVMVLLGSLTMEEAYRNIQWQAIFLIAGMLPLGIAMQNSGAANYIAAVVVDVVGPLGPTALIAGLFLLAVLASQVMPNPVVVVLMAPIALNTANDLGMSPYALIMLVALAASATFLGPVSHPANVMVMGPGGYRFKDYLKVGLPLTALVLALALLVLPLVWPLFP